MDKKFNAGDRVRLISLDLPTAGFSVGDIVTLSPNRIGSRDWEIRKDGGPTKGFSDEEHMELVSAAEPEAEGPYAGLVPGALVRFKGPRADILNGTVFSISRVDLSRDAVFLNNHRRNGTSEHDSTRDWVFSPFSFEIVQAPKAGDKVRITRNTSLHEFAIGETVRINSGPDRDGDFEAEKLDRSGYWYIRPGEFALVEEPVTAAAPELEVTVQGHVYVLKASLPELAPEPHKWSWGDWAVFDGDGEHYMLITTEPDFDGEIKAVREGHGDCRRLNASTLTPCESPL